MIIQSHLIWHFSLSCVWNKLTFHQNGAEWWFKCNHTVCAGCWFSIYHIRKKSLGCGRLVFFELTDIWCTYRNYLLYPFFSVSQEARFGKMLLSECTQSMRQVPLRIYERWFSVSLRPLPGVMNARFAGNGFVFLHTVHTVVLSNKMCWYTLGSQWPPCHWQTPVKSVCGVTITTFSSFIKVNNQKPAGNVVDWLIPCRRHISRVNDGGVQTFLLVVLVILALPTSKWRIF